MADSEKHEYVKLNPGYAQHFWSSGNGFTIGINEVKIRPRVNSMVDFALKQRILLISNEEEYNDFCSVEKKQREQSQQNSADLRARRELEEKNAKKASAEVEKKKEDLLKEKSESEILSSEPKPDVQLPELADPSENEKEDLKSKNKKAKDAKPEVKVDDLPEEVSTEIKSDGPVSTPENSEEEAKIN